MLPAYDYAKQEGTSQVGAPPKAQKARLSKSAQRVFE